MGTVAVGWVLALSTAAESEGLTGFCIDFVGKRLPAHEAIISQASWKESGKCEKMKGEKVGLTHSSYTNREVCGWGC
jgi:hypothetical protein